MSKAAVQDLAKAIADKINLKSKGKDQPEPPKLLGLEEAEKSTRRPSAANLKLPGAKPARKNSSARKDSQDNNQDINKEFYITRSEERIKAKLALTKNGSREKLLSSTSRQKPPLAPSLTNPSPTKSTYQLIHVSVNEENDRKFIY